MHKLTTFADFTKFSEIFDISRYRLLTVETSLSFLFNWFESGATCANSRSLMVLSSANVSSRVAILYDFRRPAFRSECIRESSGNIHTPGSAVGGGPDVAYEFMAEGRYDFGLSLATGNVGCAT
jgi:hypothetical protein